MPATTPPAGDVGPDHCRTVCIGRSLPRRTSGRTCFAACSLHGGGARHLRCQRCWAVPLLDKSAAGQEQGPSKYEFEGPCPPRPTTAPEVGCSLQARVPPAPAALTDPGPLTRPMPGLRSPGDLPGSAVAFLDVGRFLLPGQRTRKGYGAETMRVRSKRCLSAIYCAPRLSVAARGSVGGSVDGSVGKVWAKCGVSADSCGRHPGSVDGLWTPGPDGRSGTPSPGTVGAPAAHALGWAG